MTDRCWQLHLICRRGPESRDSYILIQSDAKPDPVVYRTYTRGCKTAARHDRGRRHSETLKKYSEDTQLHDKYSEMNRNTVSEDVTNIQYQISLCFQSKIALLWLDPTVGSGNRSALIGPDCDAGGTSPVFFVLLSNRVSADVFFITWSTARLHPQTCSACICFPSVT